MSLDPPPIPSPPLLDDLPSLIWSQLTRATADRRHPWRWPALSTVTQEGAPSVRMVVLRQVDTSRQTLSVFTDVRSAKVGQIAREPRVSLLFWHPGKRWQLRADGIATVSEDPQTFQALPDGAKGDYGAIPAPGVPLGSPSDWAPTLPKQQSQEAQAQGREAGTGGGASAFRRLTITLNALDWLSLATEPPARAILDLRTVSQTWVAP